jgi:excisionase family DNA binding protein
MDSTNKENQTTESKQISEGIRLYSVIEVSHILHTSKEYVYKLIASGALPATKMGSLKIRYNALQDFLAHADGKDFSDPFRISVLNTTD